jgi:hypothetical protein
MNGRTRQTDLYERFNPLTAILGTTILFTDSCSLDMCVCACKADTANSEDEILVRKENQYFLSIRVETESCSYLD